MSTIAAHVGRIQGKTIKHGPAAAHPSTTRVASSLRKGVSGVSDGIRSGIIPLSSQPRSNAIAARFTDGIVDDCESLTTFPNRGNRRDDVRPGLRITS